MKSIALCAYDDMTFLWISDYSGGSHDHPARTAGTAAGVQMSKYRKKPIVIEAHQWFKNGDHPDDACVLVRLLDKYGNPGELVPDPTSDASSFLSEGKVVRYFRHPLIPGSQVCSKCNQSMHVHGWIDTLEDGHNVCPGDWIITGVKGERYPCKPNIFAATYERLDAARASGEEMTKLERAALKAADQALTDWVRQYAPEQCNPATVAESTMRLYWAGGTLAYIARVRKQIKKALK